MSKAQTRLARTRRISVHAIVWPKQSRDPPPKCLNASRLSEAKREDGEVAAGSSQRSGRNVEGW